MGLIRRLKEIKWDLCSRRFLYIQAVLSWIPSRTGYDIRAWFYRRWLKSLGERTWLMEGLYIRNPKQLSIGNRCTIGVGVRLQAAGGLTIGDYVIVGPGASIWTSNHLFSDPDKPIRDQGQEYKEVIIGDDVWIGANVFVMPGAHIPKGCVISAGSIVAAKRYKEFSILAGNPARVIGYRGKDRKPAERPSEISTQDDLPRPLDRQP